MKTVINRIVFLICFMIIWEIIFRLNIFPSLLFPSIFSIFKALIIGFKENDLLIKTINSLMLIFKGILLGIIISTILMCLSVTSKVLNDIINNIILFMNPIPSLAIFPLCILWFGIGENALLFVMMHSVVWGLLLNMLSGIRAIPDIYKEIGMNLELSKYKLIKDIYIPACMPYIISGIKVSLARAWRTAISVEMIAGVIGSEAGLGWYMTYQRNTLDMAGLFSTLIIIVAVGILLEDVVFKTIENKTIKKWGMIK